MPCPPPCAAQRARSIDHPPLGTASSMYPPMYPVVAPTAPRLRRVSPAAPSASKGRFSHRIWRRLILRAWAACRVVIRPAHAAFTNPGRCSSFRLNVKVSIEGGSFHVAVTRTLSCSSNKCLIAGLTKHPLCTTVPSPAAHSGHARHDLGWRCRARRRGGRRPAPFDDHAGGGVSACATRGLGRVADAKR